RHHALRLTEPGLATCFGVIEAFQIEVPFSGGPAALVPKRSPSPGVSANHPASVGSDPGMMMQDAADAEKLDMAEFVAEVQHKAVTKVDVLPRFGQAGPEDQDPTV